MATSHVLDAQVDSISLRRRVPGTEYQTVARLLEREFNAPRTSSAGRLFDAVAALIGLRDRVSYEGQAAIELEWLAAKAESQLSYPFEIGSAAWDAGTPQPIDTRPIIRAVVNDCERGIDATVIACRFHTTMAEMIRCVCTRIRGATGIDSVVLTGGVFMNALLTTDATALLVADGFRVYRHRLVPPNDGGLSLGQLAIAASLMRE